MVFGGEHFVFTQLESRQALGAFGMVRGVVEFSHALFYHLPSRNRKEGRMKRHFLKLIFLLPMLFSCGHFFLRADDAAPNLGAYKKKEGNNLFFEGRGEPKGQEGNTTQRRSLAQE